MYIYQADLWCDDCGSKICEDLVKSGKANEIIPFGALMPLDNDALVWLDNAQKGDPDALASLWDEFNFDPQYPNCELDEHDYDSDDFPKYVVDPGPSDSVQHCGAGAACENRIRLDDDRRIGALLTDSTADLTLEGVESIYQDLRDATDRNEVTLYWMAEISGLSWPAYLYSVQLENRDGEDPFQISLTVQGPYADEWADAQGSIGGGTWETADGPDMVYDYATWEPGCLARWEAEGFRLDCSQYSEPDDHDLEVSRHATHCDECFAIGEDHGWSESWERFEEHYDLAVAQVARFREISNDWFKHSNPLQLKLAL